MIVVSGQFFYACGVYLVLLLLAERKAKKVHDTSQILSHLGLRVLVGLGHFAIPFVSLHAADISPFPPARGCLG